MDNPIESSTQDTLGRASVAHDFATAVRELDASHGVVVGVLGAWGHGKTSFVNLMREQFAMAPGLPVVDFNPWAFSGDQQLTDVFFREVAAELRMKDETRFGTIAAGLEKYGDVLSPLALVPMFGGWFDRSFRATKAATKWWSERKKGSRTFKDQVVDALRDLAQPIVVVIDDIDRLTTGEIRDIFKLVRLTASFPNVIYVLAFDRHRVEHALGEDGAPGRAYLEKILQLSFDVPMVAAETLRAQVFERLNLILGDTDGARFDNTVWPDVYVEIIEPLVHNLRDATRFALSAKPTLRALGSRIETVDVLALEALRVFRPEIFAAIHRARVALTETQGAFGGNKNSDHQSAIDKLLAVADQDSDVVRALIRRLFPAARTYLENTSYGAEWKPTWKRDHRVAYIGYLELYFGRTLPTDLVAVQHAEVLLARLTDPTALAEYLDALPKKDWESVISELETYQTDFVAESVIPASIALLNRIPDMPERQNRGMLDWSSPDIVVTRVVIRLLRRIDDEPARDAAVRQIFAGVETLSSREVLIHSVGALKDPANDLISAECVEDLTAQLVDQAEAGPSRAPEREWNLLTVYLVVADFRGEAYVPPSLPEVADVRALLQSSRSVSRAQSEGSRHVREEPRLAWDALVRVAGGAEKLAVQVGRLREADGDTELVELAEKYLSGWRPERY
ncbi:KAP family P-loop NTPase fold protein [Microbacterium sp. USHLN272]|uniref:KAP family P-loop NTPase fold protein n=1 Tax=Microbacterium sp. USHLN272 TaxID=3081287 RepID=UPI0030197CEE